MKVGYRVVNCVILRKDNSILVSNYKNEIYNLPIELNKIDLFKDKFAVGLWKLKKINN